MPDYITIAEVREDILDRTAEDHLVISDLAFTDDDITWAMKACARKFNSIPPLCWSVTWDCLTQTTNVFYDGIAWALFRRWMRNASINDFQYSAGGVTSNVQGSLLTNLERTVAKLEKEFVETATNLKIAINIADAFGPIG